MWKGTVTNNDGGVLSYVLPPSPLHRCCSKWVSRSAHGFLSLFNCLVERKIVGHQSRVRQWTRRGAKLRKIKRGALSQWKGHTGGRKQGRYRCCFVLWTQSGRGEGESGRVNYSTNEKCFFLNKGLIGQRGCTICIELNDNIEAWRVLESYLNCARFRQIRIVQTSYLVRNTNNRQNSLQSLWRILVIV